jgi:glucokinase
MSTIGIDVGGTTIKAGRVAADGTILQSGSRTTPVSNLDGLIGALEALVRDLAASEPIEAVGVGIPGLRDSATARILVSPNIPCLDGAPVEAALADRLGLPVLTRNDADMSAWGEFVLGAGAGTRHMVCLTLGTGVGSGLVLDGQLYNGSSGYAAEAGHITVNPEGLPCSCGSRGCLEAVASATGIVALARARFGTGEGQALPEPWTAESLARAASEGHTGAQEVFDEAGRYLGIACATLMNLLNPEAIVLAGGVMASGDLILQPAIEEARLRAFDATFDACRVVPARLGRQAGLIGAALFAGHTVESSG